MKELLSEIRDLLKETDEGGATTGPSAELEIREEPELIACEFLILDCLEKDTGRAMAMKNFWSYRCLR